MENNDNILGIIKIGCFGDSSVGKTRLAWKYVKCESDFDLSTVGVEYFMTNKILSDGKKYKIKIFVTAGQYRSLCLSAIRSCDGIILMYDITRRNTFSPISNWYNNICELADEDFPLILIGDNYNENLREVSKEEGKKQENAKLNILK